MPLVNVHMAEGRTVEQKRALMAAITEAMVEHVGAARESVRVWILEFPTTDYMAAGEVLSDKRARLASTAGQSGVAPTEGGSAGQAAAAADTPQPVGQSAAAGPDGSGNRGA